MRLALEQVLLNVLQNRPTEPVFFVPVPDGAHVPVKLTDVQVSDDTLKLSARPLTAPERQAFMRKLTQPQTLAENLPD